MIKRLFPPLLLMAMLIPALSAQEDLGRIRVSEEEVSRELERLVIQGQLQDKEYDETETAQLRENAKEGIIMRKLLLALAGYKNISVSPEEIEAALSETRGEYPDKEWNALLESQLYTPESFRTAIEEGLIIDRVVKTEVLDRISISEEDIRTYYEAHGNEFSTDHGLLPLGDVEEYISLKLLDRRRREETALFMADLYSRAMFVEGDPTPIQ